MGNCCDKDLIERALAEEIQQNHIKLLILGTAGGGKSTLLKQFRILHQNGFESAEERLKYRGTIYTNVTQGLARMLEGAERMAVKWELAETKKSVAELEAYLKSEYFIDPLECGRQSAGMEKVRFFNALKQFWTDPALHRDVLPFGHLFQLVECTTYFMNALERISAPIYVPTVQDILMARAPTTGIVEITLNIKRLYVSVIDVGGQRTERKKWLHCFDNVQAIIFVAAISEFDQTMEEDNGTNRLIVSLQLFHSICISPWFIATAMILFLNKTDIFGEKVRTKSIKSCFTNYTGSASHAAQLRFVEHKFLAQNPNPHKRLFCHRTCATDTDQMELVLENVFELVLISLFKRTTIM